MNLQFVSILLTLDDEGTLRMFGLTKVPKYSSKLSKVKNESHGTNLVKLCHTSVALNGITDIDYLLREGNILVTGASH